MLLLWLNPKSTLDLIYLKLNLFFVPQSFYKKFPLQLSLVILSAVCLLWYVLYKASHTSFTHDESYTYTHYVHQAFMDIISYKTPYTNNHILNTVFMKYCEAFFGSSELILRLPNIMAFIIYSFFTVLLFYKFCPKLVLPFYLILALNPHLLDFFTLARGYGLSFAFLMMSLYYLSSYFISKQNKHLILFNASAFLAVMSNFSLLNYYVAALIVYNIVLFILSKLDALNNPYHFYKQNKINLIALVISGMVLYEPLRRISKMNLLDFGGKNGFLEDTVSTAVYSLFYEMNVTDFYLTIFKILILLTVAITFILIFLKIIKKDLAFFQSQITLVTIHLILMAMVVITIMQHVFLGNDFYIHRFALFFYPLFMSNLAFLIIYFYNRGLKKTGTLIGVLLAGLLIFNLYTNYNLNYYKDWKYDKDTKLVMQQLVLEHQTSPDKQMRLGINWLLEPGTNFYRYIWDLRWMNPTHRRGVHKNDHYLYMFKSDKEYEGFKNKPVLYANESSGMVLLKNKD